MKSPPRRCVRGALSGGGGLSLQALGFESVLEFLERVPFVSGTNFRTKSQDPMLMATKSRNVPVEPSAEFSTGKANEISALVHHSTNTAIPIAKPRMLSGKISDSNSQTQVPMNICTKATNNTMQARMT